MGCVIGFCAVFPLICACGRKLFMTQIIRMSGMSLKACLCSGLALLLKRSSACDVDALEPSSCTWAVGGKACIAATALFGVAGILMNCTVAGAIIQQEGGMEGEDVEKGDEEAR